MKTSITLKILATVLLAFGLITAIIAFIDILNFYLFYDTLLLSIVDFIIECLNFVMLIAFVWVLNERTYKWLLLPLGVNILIIVFKFGFGFLYTNDVPLEILIPYCLTILVFVFLIINVFYDYRFNIPAIIILLLLPLINYFSRTLLIPFNSRSYFYFLPMILILILGRQVVKQSSYRKLIALKEKLDRNLISNEKYEAEKAKLIRYI